MPKLIIVEFIGGFRDGLVLRSDEPNQSYETVPFLYKATRDGTIGRGFRCVSEAALAATQAPDYDPENDPNFELRHKYEITAREDDGETVRLKMEYSLIDS